MPAVAPLSVAVTLIDKPHFDAVIATAKG